MVKITIIGYSKRSKEDLRIIFKIVAKLVFIDNNGSKERLTNMKSKSNCTKLD